MDLQIGWKILEKPCTMEGRLWTITAPSPSPCLDFEEGESERRMYIHSISLEGNVRATTYEEGKTEATWFRVEIANSLMGNPRLKESLVRKLLKIRRFQGEEPQTFGRNLTEQTS